MGQTSLPCFPHHLPLCSVGHDMGKLRQNGTCFLLSSLPRDLHYFRGSDPLSYSHRLPCSSATKLLSRFRTKGPHSSRRVGYHNYLERCLKTFMVWGKGRGFALEIPHVFFV